jgi:hypothetical protein
MGKRERDKQGKNIFASITLGSPEEDIIDVYLQSGANSILSALSQLLFSYSVNATTAEATFKYTRSSHVVSGVQKGISSYCVYFTVGEYLAMDFPELAKKYYDLAERTRRDVIMLAFSKLPPNSSGVDYDYDSGGDSGDDDGQTVVYNAEESQYSEGTYVFKVPASAILTMYNSAGALRVMCSTANVPFALSAGDFSVLSSTITPTHDFTSAEISNINSFASQDITFTPTGLNASDITANSTLTLTTQITNS